MPTADRRAFVAQAIQYFLRQDYAPRELIIVDDGADAVQDLVPPDPRLRYLRLNPKRNIGAKRNVACQEARGEIIVHWDDDDWMANWRISYQVANLVDRHADICGLDRLLYYDIGTGQAWQYTYPQGERTWVSGNTLCYTRQFWTTNPFPEINVGEDTRFVWSPHPKQVITLQNSDFYVATIHGANASPKHTRGSYWHTGPSEHLRELMGDDFAFYARLGPGL